MIEMNFTPFPVLFSNRLVLRKLNPADDAAIFDLRSNDSVNKYIGRPKPKLIIEATDFITFINNGIDKNERLYWAISLKENTELIGTICLWNFVPIEDSAELGYELNPAFQGTGFMNEALKTVIHFVFSVLPFKSINAFTQKENAASIKLLIKNGFVANANKVDEHNENSIAYSLIKIT